MLLPLHCDLAVCWNRLCVIKVAPGSVKFGFAQTLSACGPLIVEEEKRLKIKKSCAMGSEIADLLGWAARQLSLTDFLQCRFSVNMLRVIWLMCHRKSTDGGQSNLTSHQSVSVVAWHVRNLTLNDSVCIRGHKPKIFASLSVLSVCLISPSYIFLLELGCYWNIDLFQLTGTVNVMNEVSELQTALW